MQGQSAIKIQSYEANTMTIDSDKADFMIEGGLWDGYKLLIYMKRLKHHLHGIKNSLSMHLI